MATPGLVPPDAWDTHIHIFDPESFPYGTPRSYTPKKALLNEYPFETTTCANLVVVQATVQGHSAEPLLATLDGNGKPDQCTHIRGICTVDPTTISDGELDALHAAGVRGVRMHEMSWGHGTQSGIQAISDKIRAAAARVARLCWVIDVFTDVYTWAAMAPMIRNDVDPRVKLIADHMGGAFPGDEKLEDFGVFLGLIRDGLLYVKLSGFERLYHGHSSGMQTLESALKSVVAAGPERILYGSGMSLIDHPRMSSRCLVHCMSLNEPILDWPHTQLGVSRKGKTDQQRLNEVEDFRHVEDRLHIETLRNWIAEESTWTRLWCDNPRRLFE